MKQLYTTVLEAAAASLFLLPAFLVLNRFRFHSIKVTLFYLVFAVYLCGVYAVVGLPNVSYIRFDLNLNLIPFTGMLSDLSGTVMNVVLFIPLGFFLFLLWKPFRHIQNMLRFGFALSLAIEVLQIFTFRATDVNDLITNTTGALAGYGLGWLAVKMHPSMTGKRSLADLCIVMALSAGTMFIFQPLIWNMIEVVRN